MTGGELSTGTLLLAGTLLLFGGALLLKKGLWPCRRGDEPFCRGCQYNLTGLTSNRCPECGQVVTVESTIYGQRNRRPRIVAIALLFTALAMGCFLQAGRKQDWYRVWPVAWVKADLNSGRASAVQRAWEELMRRDQAGRLSDRQQADLVKWCLAEQVAPAPTHLMLRDMMDYLATRFLEGTLSSEDKTTFFEQIITLDLQVRPRIVVGDRLPFSMPWPMNRGPAMSFWFQLDECPLLIDGRPVGRRARRGKTEHAWGGVGGTSRYGRAWDLAPGSHTLGTLTEVRYYRGPYKGVEESRLCHTQTLRLEERFEVLATEPADFVKAVDDPSLKDDMFLCVRPEHLALKGDSKVFTCDIHMSGLQMNVAFDVYVRTGKYEEHVGQCFSRPGPGTHSFGVEASWERGAVDNIDIILRSSEEMARKTVDIYEFWQGELVHEDIPVEIE